MITLEYPALLPAPRRWVRWILVLALVLLECWLCCWSRKQGRLHATTGVRFDRVLQASELQSALDFTAGEQNEEKIYASFWGEQIDDVGSGTGHKAENVFCIGYYGNAADCLPVNYCYGTAPGTVGEECALSTALAETLFGTDNVTGLQVTLQGKNYTVCGVFPSVDRVLLFPSEKNLTGAELRGISLDAPKTETENWCAAAGLPTPGCILYGPQWVWLCTLFCWGPLLVTGCLLLIVFFRLSRDWPAVWRDFVWLLLALGLALLLPLLLESMPGWLIPARWSDFSFWGNLAARIREGLQACKYAPVYWRDIGLP